MVEHFMNVPIKEARMHLLNYLETGDLVVVRVMSMNERGLLANLVCFDDFTKRRDIEQLELEVIFFCTILLFKLDKPRIIKKDFSKKKGVLFIKRCTAVFGCPIH
jgi:hypothetical protein